MRKRLNPLRLLAVFPRLWLALRNRLRARYKDLDYLLLTLPSSLPAYTCASDAIYYGFDPENPNARYSAPNKLYEAVAAGRPLITGDFGEIADVVRKAHCGIVLPSYSPESVREALSQLQDPARRRLFADNAGRYGRTAMNWGKGREILCGEYSALVPSVTGATLCLE